VISRRHFLAASAAVVASSLVPRPARAQDRVRIGTAVLGDYSVAAPIAVATDRGFFKQEGLDVEYAPFTGGADLVKAVSAGEVLLAVSGGTDILVFRERGARIKMLATHVESNHFTLNVSPEIQTVADLKGKAIGVTAPDSTTWIFARMIARRQGWDPDRDVRIVSLGGLDDQVAALTRKETSAFVFGDAGAVTQHRGTTRVLMPLDELTPKWISMIHYASEAQIARNADAIRQGMRAIFRAMRLMRDTPQTAAAITARDLGWAPEAVRSAQKITGPLLSYDGRFSVEALATMQASLLEMGVLEKKLRLEEHFTQAFTPVKLT
jgi:NitT/TauT family transport system substrate-binding protein